MKLRHTKLVKALFAIVPALLLVLALQPAVALAGGTVTVKCEGSTVAIDGSVVSFEYTLDPLTLSETYPLADDITVSYDVARAVYDTQASSYLPQGWEVDYWTADCEVYTLQNNALTRVNAGARLDSNARYSTYVARNTTFIAHLSHDPITVTYISEGYMGTHGVDEPHGGLVFEGESHPWYVPVDVTYGSTVSKVPGTIPYEGYLFFYWVSDSDVIIDGKTIPAETPITPEQLKKYVPTKYGINFYAHFAKGYTISYTTDGNGSLSSDTELVETGDSIVTVTANPKSGYTFDYWTSEVAVVIDSTEYDAGYHLSTDMLKKIVPTSDMSFEAHFKEVPVDPDTDDRDDSATVKPADGTGDKLLPKTGDVLPGVVGVAATGAVLLAGAAFARKRCC